MAEAKKVETYFDKKAEGFDAFYSGRKNIFSRVLDRLFRKSMKERFKETLNECYNIENKRILDVGCGSGRYSVELAKKGPKKVVGIDFADNMLRIAQELARKNQVQETCEFIKTDLFKFQSQEKFDISIAIGFFDYFKNSKAALEKIRELTKGKAIMSFPSKWDLRTIFRKIRLTILGCPVYFYTKKELRLLLSEAGFDNFEVRDLGRDYLVVANI